MHKEMKGLKNGRNLELRVIDRSEGDKKNRSSRMKNQDDSLSEKFVIRISENLIFFLI